MSLINKLYNKTEFSKLERECFQLLEKIKWTKGQRIYSEHARQITLKNAITTLSTMGASMAGYSLGIIESYYRQGFIENGVYRPSMEGSERFIQLGKDLLYAQPEALIGAILMGAIAFNTILSKRYMRELIAQYENQLPPKIE